MIEVKPDSSVEEAPRKVKYAKVLLIDDNALDNFVNKKLTSSIIQENKKQSLAIEQILINEPNSENIYNNYGIMKYQKICQHLL